MPFLDKDDLEKLYARGLSMAEIASKKGTSVHKISYWLKKYKIPSRSISEAIYIKNNATGDPFRISTLNTDEEKELFNLGIGLFLGEGTKKQRHSVRFANSDSKIIVLFLKFLRNICNINPKKIRAWVNIFDDNSYNASLIFWMNQTGIPRDNFYSPVIRTRKEGSYKNRSKYGTITIVVSNTKLLKQIKQWCEDYLNKYAEVAQW